ncbi:uncharacterized protein LOC109842175 [Asparagus officinalis]|uniref:uncharacterized protein LOC109842175 n=1 Tax=Asparagus officinalis TaxID=4686 RepID=UPI00098E442F|nr:uncharacterized protein LOC109842175 [Asparagus officinalis]
MKYANDEGEVRTLIAEKYPFRGVENFHTDSVFYLESQEKEDVDSGNEADVEPDPQGNCPWELNFDVIGSVENNNNVPSEGEWCINEDFILAYLSDESFKVGQIVNDRDAGTHSWHALCTEACLTMPIKSSFASNEEVEDAQKAFYKVPSKRKGQKPIQFGERRLALKL